MGAAYAEGLRRRSLIGGFVAALGIAGSGVRIVAGVEGGGGSAARGGSAVADLCEDVGQFHFGQLLVGQLFRQEDGRVKLAVVTD